MNRIQVRDSIDRVVFEITEWGSCSYAGGEVDPRRTYHPDNVTTIDFKLEAGTKRRGLNGELIEYFQVGYGGDIVRRIEGTVKPFLNHVWWELYMTSREARGVPEPIQEAA